VCLLCGRYKESNALYVIVTASKDDDVLRLRKRTRLGMDHTLKRAGVLIHSLQRKFDGLISVAHQSFKRRCARSAAPQRTSRGTDEDKQSSTKPPEANPAGALNNNPAAFSVQQMLPLHAFITASEGRFVIAGLVATQHHVLLDCNQRYCEQYRRPREQLTGRNLQEIFVPVTLARYHVALQLLWKHQALIVRNIPSYVGNSVGDLIAWIDVRDNGRTYFFNGILMNQRPVMAQRTTDQGLQMEKISMQASSPQSDPPSPLTAPGQLPPPSTGSATVQQPTVETSLGHDASAASRSPPAVMTASSQDQCGVAMALHNSENADTELVIIPWRSDGSDCLNTLPPMMSTTRSEVLGKLPMDVVQNTPELLSLAVDSPTSTSDLDLSSSLAEPVSSGVSSRIASPPTPKRQLGVVRYYET